MNKYDRANLTVTKIEDDPDVANAALTAQAKREQKQEQYRPVAGRPDLIGVARGAFMQDIRRIELIDELRGICVLAMVAYHSFFILGSQFGAEWGMRAFEFFRPAQPAFAAMFILISGFCSRLSRDVKMRGIMLAVVAAGITLATVLLLPYLGFDGMRVWFGIIHLLAVSKFLFGLKPVRWICDRIPAPVGLLLCLAAFFLFAPVSQGYLGMFGFHLDLPEKLYQSNALAFLGFNTPAFEAFDHFPLLPYIFIYLFGTFMGKLARKEKKPGSESERENLPDFCYEVHSRLFRFLGRNALIIYLLHVPVFYGLAYFLQSLFSMGKH